VIISKTPLRISFLGGGTDYPEYFLRHGGAVLGTAIDKYAYFSVSHFYSRLFDYSIRIAYRQVECVQNLDEIQHGPFRECLRWSGLTQDIEVDHAAELPAFTGLGSSSTFVVGLLHALHAFKGRSVRGMELAYEAIRVEREVLCEPVGCQDQTFAAMGGMNMIEFRGLSDIVVHRVPLSPARQEEIEAHLMVVYTGTRRRANDITSAQIKRIDQNIELLHRMHTLVDDGYNELTSNRSLEHFGKLVDQSWQLKSQLENGISNGQVRQLYRRALDAGAFGGKLLGAGGGGFLLFIVPPERHQAVLDALDGPQEIAIRIGAPGSHIINS
jgi:D-glycero-alpha-D-manno-heptose-7-phosphate kinase